MVRSDKFRGNSTVIKSCTHQVLYSEQMTDRGARKIASLRSPWMVSMLILENTQVPGRKTDL